MFYSSSHSFLDPLLQYLVLFSCRCDSRADDFDDNFSMATSLDTDSIITDYLGENYNNNKNAFQ